MQVEYASFIAILCSGIIAIVYSYLALDYYISEFPSEEDKELKTMFTGIVILIFMMLLPALFSLFLLSEEGLLFLTLMMCVLMGALFLTFASVVTALGFTALVITQFFLSNE